MRALKVVPTLLALTLAVPAFARPAGEPPSAAAAAAHKDRAAKRDARLEEALVKQGIDKARAKKVVTVVKKYRTEKKPVHEQARTHRQNLRRLNEATPKDENAINKELAALKTSREKLDRIHDREVAELNTILKPSERAKLMEVMQRAKKHKAKAGKNKETAKKPSPRTG